VENASGRRNGICPGRDAVLAPAPGTPFAAFAGSYVFGNGVMGRWRSLRVLQPATRWGMVRDLRLLSVFAVLRGGCGGRCPGSGGC
jgi:hypothetical protein